MGQVWQTEHSSKKSKRGRKKGQRGGNYLKGLNVGRPEMFGGLSSEYFWIDGQRLRAATKAPQRGKGRAVPERCPSIRSTDCIQGWFMKEISRSNRMKNVLSLQVAREHARQPRGGSNGHVSKLSDQRALERLEAENALLRDSVVDLMLQIQALRDGAR